MIWNVFWWMIDDCYFMQNTWDRLQHLMIVFPWICIFFEYIQKVTLTIHFTRLFNPWLKQNHITLIFNLIQFSKWIWNYKLFDTIDISSIMITFKSDSLFLKLDFNLSLKEGNFFSKLTDCYVNGSMYSGTFNFYYSGTSCSHK